MNPTSYESSKLLNEYLLFHYGNSSEMQAGFPVQQEGLHFPLRTAAPAIANGGGRALDLGCAVGRSTFELARAYDDVIGIDFSQAFVDAAERIRVDGAMSYQILVEASQTVPASAMLPDGVDASRVSFEQADAMSLREDLGTFDCVHAANLICRLTDPLKLITRFRDLVRANGLLVLATPFTWLEEFTPRENWLGSEKQSGFDELSVLLDTDFELLSSSDEPFLIRETARKYQFTYSKLSVWKRRLESAGS